MGQRKISKRLMRTKPGHVSLVGRQPAQNKCAWCGEWMLDDRPCIDDAQRNFIIQFSMENGRSWKKILNDQWFSAKGPSESLQLRNSRGPSWLEWFKLSRVDEIKEAVEFLNRVARKLEREMG